MTKTFRLFVILALGSTLCQLDPAEGQAVAPASTVLPGELKPLTQRLAGQLLRLSDDIVTELGPPPSDGAVLGQDATELSQAVTEFQSSLPERPDRFQVRRVYAGIDTSWHYLLAMLTRPEVANPNLTHELEDIAQTDQRIHQLLGLNPYPPTYFGASSPPVGLSETRRLAQALVDRAEALAAVVRTDLPGEAGLRAAREAENLVRVADDYHDGIDLSSRVDIARNGFAGVAAMSKSMRRDLSAVPNSRRVLDAWQAYARAEVLLHQNLGLPNAPDDLRASAIPAQGPSPIDKLAEQLVSQVDVVVQTISPLADKTPEGKLLLADARRLQLTATDFRKDVGRRLNASQLAFEFRDVDASWQRLARRTNRITRGGNAPYLEQVRSLGATCAELHQLLGLPGYPPVLGPFSGATLRN